MSSGDAFLERPPSRKAVGESSNDTRNMVVWIVLIILGLILLGFLIWYLVSSTETDNKPKPPDKECPCTIGVPEVTCCEIECPQTFLINWTKVEHADYYILTIDYTDEVNETTEQFEKDVVGNTFIFKLDPNVYSNQISMDVSVKARSKKCDLTGEPGQTSKVAKSSRPGGWMFTSDYLAQAGGAPLNSGPLAPTAAPADLPSGINNRASHLFTGPPEVPYDVEMSVGANGSTNGGKCMLRIEEVPRSAFTDGDYTDATLLYEDATPEFVPSINSFLITTTVVPTLEDSVWVYSCENDIDPTAVDTALESIRVVEQ